MLRSIFAHPHWLQLLWIIPVLFLVLRAYSKWRGKAMAALGPRSGRLVEGFSMRRFWRQNGLVLGAMALVIVALANPRWGQRTKTQTQKGADVIIALDISRSMLATDIKPSRMFRARLFAQELIKKIPGNKIGLLFFAGEAYLSMPLSTDYPTITSLLAEAAPESYSAQGTAIQEVVELAIKSFEDAPGAGRALVMITDGENHEEEPVSAVENAYHDKGIVTFVVGAGTPNGGPIPLANGGLMRDENNKAITTVMNTELLADLADAGRGAAPFFIADANNPAQQLADEINALDKREIAIRSFDEKDARFQWLLLPAILALFIASWMGWSKKQ